MSRPAISTWSRVMAFKAPALMVAGLLAAVGTALGHHFFNKYLNGRAANHTLHSQSVVHGIGNGFATLFRSLAIFAIAAAYTQLFFTKTSKRAYKVKDIDTMYTAPRSIIDCFTPSFVRKHKTLFGLALLLWLIPVASTIPQASLVVHLAPAPDQVRNVTLHSIDFNGTALYGQRYDQVTPQADIVSTLKYTGPQYNLDSIVQRVASSGRILDISPLVPEPNSSHVLTYAAPALRCSPAAPSVLSQLTKQLGCVPGGLQYNASHCDAAADTMPIYLAWTPSSSSTQPPNFTTAGPTRMSSYGLQPLSFFMSWAADDYTILNCSIWKANYTTTFAYTNGQQSVRTNTIDIRPGPKSLPWDTLYATPVGSLATQEDLNIMAMMDSVGKLMLGSVGLFKSSVSLWAYSNTSVLATSLLWSTELSQVGEAYTNYTLGSLPAVSQVRNSTVQQAVEELFENITVSLFSDSRYRTSNTSAEVTISSYENIYVYIPLYLWAVYGAICGVTLAAVMIGLASIEQQRAFSNKFSTVLRVTRGSAINNMVERDDVYGQDPLRSPIKEAEIQLGRDHTSGAELVEMNAQAGRRSEDNISVADRQALLAAPQEHLRSETSNDTLVDVDVPAVTPAGAILLDSPTKNTFSTSTTKYAMPGVSGTSASKRRQNTPGGPASRS